MCIERVKKILIENLDLKEKDICYIEKIFKGYSNHVYKVEVSGKKIYKVRIADNNDFISRKNEYDIYKVLSLDNFLFYDKATGNSIEYWIEGRSSNKKDINYKYLWNLNKLIKKIHNTPLPKKSEILKHNDFEFFLSSKDFFSFYDQENYKKLIFKYNDDERVLCHNDISLGNLIFKPDKTLNLIDYEWGRINSRYWDYGNFIKEVDLKMHYIKYLSKIANLRLFKLIEYVYISTIFSLQLSFQFENNNDLSSYRIRLFNQLKKYREWIK